MQTLVRRNDTIIEELLAVDAMIDRLKLKYDAITGVDRLRYEELEQRKLELLQKLAISS
ncbi:MAG: hypothetical protein SVJ22_04150 [Halobacteriota archaeon]|nr:hypothetical protein [Halobacteriota archaeon]